MKPALRAAAISIAFAAIAGCGTGGGNGVVGTTATTAGTTGVPFTSFSAISPNQTVVMEGTAVTASGNQSVASDGDVTVTSANVNPMGSGTVRLTYDGNRALRAIEISTPQSSASFDRDASGHSLGCREQLCAAANSSAAAVVVDPSAVGWNYQSFGVWLGDVSSNTWSGGAMSAGSPTTGNAVPTTGNATFSGRAGGFYVDTAGTPFLTEARMSAEVNFGSRSIAFSTSGTTLLNGNTGSRSDNDNLNLSGTLSYGQGSNAFSGPVNAGQGSGLNPGTASGRFYGPAAEEIGGVYSLLGTGVSRMVGGFGGRR